MAGTRGKPLLVFLHGHGGTSMGGFGAYDIALDHPGRFCAVGGHSPALWPEGGATAPGAFDDAEDFERNDVIGAVRAYLRFYAEGAGELLRPTLQ